MRFILLFCFAFAVCGEIVAGDFFERKEADITVEGDAKLLAARFVFTNRRDYPVKIGKIHTSCGCTTVQYPQGLIQPGQEVPINFTVKRKDGVLEGKEQAIIEIDDHEQSLEVLKINLHVPSPLILTDENLFWNKDGSLDHKIVEIEAKDKYHLEDLQLSQVSNGVRAVLDKTGENKWRLLVLPPQVKGEFDGAVVLDCVFDGGVRKSYKVNLWTR